MKYLLAVDGSVYSVTAYNHLLNILNKEKDSVTILYAIDRTIMDNVNTTMALNGVSIFKYN